MSFLGFGGSNGNTVSNINPEQQEIINKIKESISQEIATGYATALVNALSENCFDKCIKNPPSDSLTPIEDKCVNDCSSKFMRSWNVISKSYVARINQQ